MTKTLAKASTGLALAALLLGSGTALAQTANTGSDAGTYDTTSSSTPGVPNTGAGSDATNMMLLVLAGAVVVGGIGYLLVAPRQGSIGS
jgi:hypothetical protein